MLLGFFLSDISLLCKNNINILLSTYLRYYTSFIAIFPSLKINYAKITTYL